MLGMDKELIRLLGYYGNVGFTFVAAIFIGLGGGYLLDQKVFGGRTAPWFTFIGLAFGIAAGFKTLFDIVSKSTKKNGDQDENK